MFFRYDEGFTGGSVASRLPSPLDAEHGCAVYLRFVRIDACSLKP